MTKINFKNLAPVAAGEIEVKPLTVFTGHNSTGKSVTSSAIYCIANTFRHLADGTGASDPMNRGRLFLGMFHVSLPDEWITDHVKSTISSWCLESHNTRQFVFDDDGFANIDLASLPPVIFKLVNKYAQKLLSETGENLNIEILSNFYSRNGPGTHDWADGSISLDNKNLRLHFSFTQDGMEIIPGIIVGGAVARIPKTMIYDMIHRYDDDMVYNIFIRACVHELMSKVDRDIFNTNVHYIPSARAGYLLSYKMIARSVIKSFSNGFRDKGDNVPIMSGITSDFIKSLLMMDGESYNCESRQQLLSVASYLCDHILHGDVYMDSHGGLPYPEVMFHARAGDVEGIRAVRIDKAPSVVVELAPIVLYLKYMVQPGDLLILEEPEARMPPYYYDRMASAIAWMVNAGLNVIVTTANRSFVDRMIMTMDFPESDGRVKYGCVYDFGYASVTGENSVQHTRGFASRYWSSVGS